MQKQNGIVDQVVDAHSSREIAVKVKSELSMTQSRVGSPGQLPFRTCEVCKKHRNSSIFNQFQILQFIVSLSIMTHF